MPVHVYLSRRTFTRAGLSGQQLGGGRQVTAVALGQQRCPRGADRGMSVRGRGSESSRRVAAPSRYSGRDDEREVPEGPLPWSACVPSVMVGHTAASTS